MARIEKLIRHILKWEVGASTKQMIANNTDEALFYACRKCQETAHDKGGLTNTGITLKTFQEHGKDKDGDGDIDATDLRMMDYSDWKGILKAMYWNRCRADEINSQSIANMIVDWAFTSGGARKQIQKVLGVDADGLFGPKTIAAINSQSRTAAMASTLFYKIKEARLRYYRSLDDYKYFGRGWTNRVNDIKFNS